MDGYEHERAAEAAFARTHQMRNVQDRRSSSDPRLSPKFEEAERATDERPSDAKEQYESLLMTSSGFDMGSVNMSASEPTMHARHGADISQNPGFKLIDQSVSTAESGSPRLSWPHPPHQHHYMHTAASKQGIGDKSVAARHAPFSNERYTGQQLPKGMVELPGALDLPGGTRSPAPSPPLRTDVGPDVSPSSISLRDASPLPPALAPAQSLRSFQHASERGSDDGTGEPGRGPDPRAQQQDPRGYAAQRVEASRERHQGLSDGGGSVHLSNTWAGSSSQNGAATNARATFGSADVLLNDAMRHALHHDASPNLAGLSTISSSGYARESSSDRRHVAHAAPKPAAAASEHSHLHPPQQHSQQPLHGLYDRAFAWNAQDKALADNLRAGEGPLSHVATGNPLDAKHGSEPAFMPQSAPARGPHTGPAFVGWQQVLQVPGEVHEGPDSMLRTGPAWDQIPMWSPHAAHAGSAAAGIAPYATVGTYYGPDVVDDEHVGARSFEGGGYGGGFGGGIGDCSTGNLESIAASSSPSEGVSRAQSSRSLVSKRASNQSTRAPSEHPLGEYPSRTLFVRNINIHTTDDELLALFNQYGEVRSMYSACKHRGFVMISYYDIRAATGAKQMLQGFMLRQRAIDVHFSVPKENATEPDLNQGTLVVFNLDPAMTRQDILMLFKQYGEVKEIRSTPRKDGHKFVEFFDSRHAHGALHSLNRAVVNRRQLKIELSRPGGVRRARQSTIAGHPSSESFSNMPMEAVPPPPPPPPAVGAPMYPGAGAMFPHAMSGPGPREGHGMPPLPVPDIAETDGMFASMMQQAARASRYAVQPGADVPIPDGVAAAKHFVDKQLLHNVHGNINGHGEEQGPVGALGYSEQLKQRRLSGQPQHDSASSLGHMYSALMFSPGAARPGAALPPGHPASPTMPAGAPPPPPPTGIAPGKAPPQQQQSQQQQSTGALEASYQSVVRRLTDTGKQLPMSNDADMAATMAAAAASAAAALARDVTIPREEHETRLHQHLLQQLNQMRIHAMGQMVMDELMARSGSGGAITGGTMAGYGASGAATPDSTDGGHMLAPGSPHPPPPPPPPGAPPDEGLSSELAAAANAAAGFPPATTARGHASSDPVCIGGPRPLDQRSRESSATQHLCGDTTPYGSFGTASPMHAPPSAAGLGGPGHSEALSDSGPITGSGQPELRLSADRRRSSATGDQFVLNREALEEGAETRTTLMIRNIPNKYSQKVLMQTIDIAGFYGKYDFFYLPIDFKNRCNVGYAFINMAATQDVLDFHKEFHNKGWERFNSEKRCCVAFARIQTRRALVAHFQNSSLMNEDKRCRPVLLNLDGPEPELEPFPAPKRNSHGSNRPLGRTSARSGRDSIDSQRGGRAR